MWFRNLIIFEIDPAGMPEESVLQAALEASPLEACGTLELNRSGWLSPFGRGEKEPLHVLNGAAYVTWGQNEKILPASVIQEAVLEKIQKIESEEARSVHRKEKIAIKDEALQDLLPRAFSHTRSVQAILDFQNHRFMVDTASVKQAEAVCDAMRQALGRFPVTPIAEQSVYRETLKRWLQQGDCEPGFQLGDECELHEGDQGAVVRCKKLELPSDEINTLLETGLSPSRLALTWDERVEFVFQDAYILRRLRFTDQVTEQLDDHHSEDFRAELDSMRALELGEIRSLIKDLAQYFPI